MLYNPNNVLNHIILTENAYFYKLKHGALTNSRVRKIFTTVSNERVGNFALREVREDFTIGSITVKYSICVFEIERLASFIDDNYQGVGFRELKYAYLLLIEYDGYLTVIRRNISGLSNLLSQFIDELDYQLISRLMLDPGVQFNKLSMKNMDISDTALRNKTIEAANARNSLSTFGASKLIVSNVRVNNGNESISVSFNTSRIAKLRAKKYLDGIIEYSIEIIDRIKNFTPQPSFLDVFANHVSYESVASNLIPKYLLLPPYSILNDIESGKISNFKFGDQNSSRQISDAVFKQFVTSFEYLLGLDDIGDGVNFKANNKFDTSLGIRKNRKSISLTSNKLSRILLEYNGVDYDLLSYLKVKNDFIVGFDNPEYIYFSRKLFQDHQLLNSIDSLLKVFIPFNQLQNCTSEKGITNSRSTSFPNNSIFSFVEGNLGPNADFVICDDLGGEWADHILIKGLK